MAERKLFVGARLKRLRKDLKLTQVRMAEELGVSASYLNLMERNQRPVTAQVLIRLVETYDLDLGMFAAEPDQRTFLALREAVSDPVLVSLGLDDTDLKELNETHPLGAQALVRLHRAYRNLSHSFAGLTERLSDEPMPGAIGERPEEVVREILQEQEGYFPEIEEAAELFCAEIRLDRSDLFRQLTARLQQLHSIRTKVMPEDVMHLFQRRFDRHSRRLLLCELLSNDQRCFHLAIQIAHLELRDLWDEKCLDERVVRAGPEARERLREAMARNFALAVLLPYESVMQVGVELAWDVQRMAVRFHTNIELMARRLVTLRKPGAQGLPMFFLRFDRAGNVVERGGSKSYGLSRFGGNCPKWNIWNVASGANGVVNDFIEMADGERFLTMAFAIDRLDPSSLDLTYTQILVLGLAADRAMETVYGQRLGEGRELHPTLIGPGCRLCERAGCGQRSMPPLVLGGAKSPMPTGVVSPGSQWSGEG
ncbi:MAG: XRE family transcriptional regulator [Robiginitomaculum sp.]|nr:MAG: XRE family transcriptional regulator [Robiginitomaculum sp.]